MPESAHEAYARVIQLVGKDGRLPTPPVAEWETFPWEGEIAAKVILLPTEATLRSDEGGTSCRRCQDPDANPIWHNERWQVMCPREPGGLPVVLVLQSREHMDFLDMDDDLASEYGRITAWLHRIVSNLPDIGRVHVCKWGDGSPHLHTWFMAGAKGRPQALGNDAKEWDDILPPTPEDLWREDLEAVARRLATHDGAALI